MTRRGPTCPGSERHGSLVGAYMLYLFELPHSTPLLLVMTCIGVTHFTLASLHDNVKQPRPPDPTDRLP